MAEASKYPGKMTVTQKIGRWQTIYCRAIGTGTLLTCVQYANPEPDQLVGSFGAANASVPFTKMA